MNFKTITDTENPLFNRREIEGEISAEVTPSREQVKQIIAEKFSAKPETIKIRTIKGKFGQKIFLIVANIYKSKEELEKIELKKKKDIESEKKAEEQKKQKAEAEEKPAEEEKEVSEEVENKSEETENGTENT